jgi:S1-C subfamily serine protease
MDFMGTTSEVPAGSGSGFIWDAQGHIVTNFHVIRGAQALNVTLHDHRTFQAKVVGVEPRKDIAVLKLEEPVPGLVPIRVNEKAAKLEVGQKTIAIGNPFGLDQTLTTGVISALGRQVDGIGGVTIRDMVQTDAAINPGNSGGPLLDSSGRLIGMNTMIFSRSGASAGIGFAVPDSSIRRVVPQIIEFGKPRQVGLGIQIDPSQRLEQRAGIKGVIVLSVVPGGPSAKAGLQGIARDQRGIRLGDVIVALNDEPVQDYDDLYNTLDRFNPGDKVQVTFVRDKKRQSVEIVLVEIP